MSEPPVFIIEVRGRIEIAVPGLPELLRVLSRTPILPVAAADASTPASPAPEPPAEPRNPVRSVAKGAAQPSPPLSAARRGGARPNSFVGLPPAKDPRTPEREKQLRELYPTADDTGVLRMLLERLPGPPFRDKQQMYAWASKLGVKRALRSPAPAADDDANAPEGDKPTLRGSRAMPIKRDVESDTKSQVSARPKAGAAPTRKAPGPLDTRDGSPSIAARRLLEESWHNSVSEVSWHDAMTWAHRNGVQLGGTEEADLVATNARRDELHLPRFAIVQARGKPEGLPDPRLTIATAA